MKFHRDLLQRKIKALDYNKYLSIKISESNAATGSYSITWTGKAIEYNVNGTKDWITLPSGTTTITRDVNGDKLIPGSIVSFRAKPGDSTIKNSVGKIGSFSVSGKYELLGNCMAIIQEEITEFGTCRCTFESMFAENKNLLSVSKSFLPARNLTDSCYLSMFQNSTLQNVPEMCIDSCGNSSCAHMFQSCPLTDASSISINGISSSAYNAFEQMFYLCSNLVTPLNINADTTTAACYRSMFRDCKALTTMPELPAETLASECYKEMFFGCTGLENIKSFAKGYNGIINIGEQSCYSMFEGCTNIDFDSSISNIFTIKSIGVSGCCRMFAKSGLKNDNGYSFMNVNATNTSSYKEMFTECSKLKYSPIASLPGNTSANCYDSMFKKCTRLIGCPQLTLSGATEQCCQWMFSECSNTELNASNITINNAAKQSCYKMFSMSGITANRLPRLSAMLLQESCYEEMFYQCNSLLTLPDGFLPANNLAKRCYYRMFKSCIHLESVSDTLLNAAMTLEHSCYYEMFMECSSLTNPPELPATTLADWCYYGMFDSSGITSFPELPATTLTERCYSSMFYECSQLPDEIPASMFMYSLPNGDVAPVELAPWCYTNMFAESNISVIPALPATVLEDHCYSYMFSGCKSISYIAENFLPATTLADSCYTNMFSYTNIDDDVASNIFNSLKNVKVLTYHCYSYMFSGCKSLEHVPTELLPISKLAYGCYGYMFQNCTSLVTVPELNAPTLADFCYSYMFSGCTSLANPPELPATTLKTSCYRYMFQNCTSLVTAPELKAEILASDCYSYMFSGCTSLANPPELPATTLTSNCYTYMFKGCKSLTTAPELPATTLANECYNSMFSFCSSLVTPPELPATTLAPECYAFMFSNCTKLTTASALHVESLTNYDYCYRCMFQNCTSLVTPPELPATTLAFSCYEGMFSGCKSLVTAPELPATTLTERCYYEMFYNCDALTSTKDSPIVLPATTLVSNCYVSMFKSPSTPTSKPLCIKALFTTNPYDSTTDTYPYTYGWLAYSDNTSQSIFIVADDAEWVNDRSHNSGSNGSSGATSRGSHAIPNKWVVYNESGKKLYPVD